MSDSARELATEEFRALRATIRGRGNLRAVLCLATFGLWAALLVATVSVVALPAATLIPLLILAAGFETVAALHIGVERIGRYLQVRYEGHGADGGPDGPAWERTAMAWGQRFPGTGTDPLFGALFLIATVLNYASAAIDALRVELLVLAVFHGLFVVRTVRVRAWAAKQREEDLERFRTLVSSGSRGAASRA
jgi:hypothetical protein